MLSSPAAVAVHARRGYVYSTYFLTFFFTFWLFRGFDVFILGGTVALEFMVRVRTWHRLVLVVLWFLTPWTTSSFPFSRSLRCTSWSSSSRSCGGRVARNRCCLAVVRSNGWRLRRRTSPDVTWSCSSSRCWPVGLICVTCLVMLCVPWLGRLVATLGDHLRPALGQGACQSALTPWTPS